MYTEKGEMQHFPKARAHKAVLALVVSSLILFAFMLLMNTNTITNVSAVEANGVEVYWDSDCSNKVSSIDWGTLEPGSVKNVAIYIRNELGEPTYLILSTTNWNPSKASDYLTLRWDYSGQRMNLGETLQITLTLSVSRYVEGISNFSFDIVIAGSQNLPGDIDGNGVVNADDILFGFGPAFLSRPGDDNWNPNADLNGNGVVNADDLLYVLAPNFGKSY